MDSEEQLAKQVEEFQKLSKENPNVNVGLLMMNALATQKQNNVSPKSKRWAYLISIGLPPFGLFFALKYFLSNEDDASSTAWTCVFLTVLSVFSVWVMGKLLLSGSHTSIDQISNIKPAEIIELGE